MTTEDDFWRLLERHPDDHQTRLIFADWLEERGDERAAGYRAMAVNGKIICNGMGKGFDASMRVAVFDHDFCRGCGPDYFMVPNDWWRRVEGGHDRCEWSVWFDNMRQAEDAVALAFARLPAHRQQELLAPALTGDAA